MEGIAQGSLSATSTERENGKDFSRRRMLPLAVPFHFCICRQTPLCLRCKTPLFCISYAIGLFVPLHRHANQTASRIIPQTKRHGSLCGTLCVASCKAGKGFVIQLLSKKRFQQDISKRARKLQCNFFFEVIILHPSSSDQRNGSFHGKYPLIINQAGRQVF